MKTVTPISVVINTCYGGFSLSREAAEMVLKRKGLKYRIETIHQKKGYPYIGTGWDTAMDVCERYDPDLVAVVEELGSERASGDSAKLKIVKFEIGVDLVCFDGKEKAHIYGSEIWE